MFLKNCWYVAAQPEEIDRTPFARTICNEPIVFWRTEAGEPVAFEDRCCHRRMPLRKGVTVGDRLRCHYHGLEFDRTGACLRVPDKPLYRPVRGYAPFRRWRNTTGSGSGSATRPRPTRP